ncbi:MAG: hypothetical protein COA82_11505 [Alkaliphilus sp.]|nr:MAG: hypothetical protein COA82_11505 [Alkaliphilus sp.]
MNRNKILRFLLFFSITILIVACNNDKADDLKHSDGCAKTVDKSAPIDDQVGIKEPEPMKKGSEKLALLEINIDVECNENKKGYSKYIHETKETSFSFVHPVDWAFEETGVWDAGMASDGHLREASPERGGVHFVLDLETEGSLSIFGTSNRYYWTLELDEIGKWDTWESVEKELIINGTKRGNIFMIERDSEVFIRISYERERSESEGYYSPSIYLFIANLNRDFYDENKDIIWEIIGSLEFRFNKVESKGSH